MMRGTVRRLAALLTGAVLLTGLPVPVLAGDAGDGEKLTVITSFYPMYDFAQKVGQDRAEVTNLVPAGTEPHDWEPSASDLAALEEADVFIYNGAGMESWVEDVLATLDNQELVVVEASRDVELLEESESGESDPHIWLDPLKAKEEMENIKDTFVEADPEQETFYEENYAVYAQEFEDLDQEFSERLGEAERRDVVVAHEAFGYLCAAYELNQVAIDGLSPDSEPDPRRMEEIIQYAEENQVTTIFFEELGSSKVAETIAEEIGAQTAVLNPIEGLTQEQQEAGADYFSVMEENLAALVEALNG